MEREITIGEVAEATGLSIHTLRYYERAGLLPSVHRNAGGHRRYTQRDVDVLFFLNRLRLTGMPIHRCRRYAELTRQGPETIADRRAMLEEHRREVCDQIAQLERNLGVLDYKIGLYERGWVPDGPGDPCLAELRRLAAPDPQMEPETEGETV